MPLNKQKFQISMKGTYQLWVIVSYVIIGLMAGSLVMSGIFVYNYTFRTLEDAHTIVLLNTDMVVNNINMPNYQKAVSLLGLKADKAEIPSKPRNIFIYPPTEAPAPEAATSTAYGNL